MLESMEKLIQEHGMLPRGSRVLCAVSGGADSVCLLHRLWAMRGELGIEVTAAHYNHGLRGAESDRDEAFVAQLARELGGIPLVIGRGDVARTARDCGQGVEETAREMRYRFLRQIARQVGADRIATAHNAGDNAETVLMHLIRGAGLRGLTGIPPVRGEIIRPLLTTNRDEIEEYLKLYRISYVTDSTNGDDTFTRNRIRHQILPALEGLCPGVAKRLGQTAELLRRDEDYLMERAMELLADCREDGGELRLPAAPLSQAPEALSLRAIRWMLGRVREDNDNCTAAHLWGVLAVCRSADPSAHVDLPGGVLARREYGLLVLTRERVAPLEGEIPLQMPGVTRCGSYRLECRAVEYQGQPQKPWEFYLSAAVTDLRLRRRRTGDMLKRPGRPTKSVKKLLIDQKIPQHLRDALPVLEGEGGVAAVAGLGVDAAFVPRTGEGAWHLTVTSAKQQL